MVDDYEPRKISLAIKAAVAFEQVKMEERRGIAE